MKLLGGLVLTALLLCCSALHADTLYDISGTATLEGTNCPTCSENFTFGLQVDESSYPGFGFAYLTLVPGTVQVAATGDLAPDTWTIGFEPGFYGDENPTTGALEPGASWQHFDMFDNTGDDIVMFVFTPGLGRTPLIEQGILMWSCGTVAACSDFGFPGVPQADEFGYPTGGPADITVTELLCVPTPEPATWALLALGLSMFIPMRAIRPDAIWSAGACSRRVVSS